MIEEILREHGIKSDPWERWSQIPDADYFVSESGRVVRDRRLNRSTPPVESRCGIVFELTPSLVGRKPKQYQTVRIFKNGGSQSKHPFVRVHRLVALCFIPNPENKPEVHHIDGNTLNNNVGNLEWVTHAENMAKTTGKRKSVKSKMSHDQLLEAIQMRRSGMFLKDIASKFGIHRSNLGCKLAVYGLGKWKWDHPNPRKKSNAMPHHQKAHQALRRRSL